MDESSTGGCEILIVGAGPTGLVLDLWLTRLGAWGKKLDFHPHLHCIVTGGALSPDGKRWRSPKQRKFLFPVRAVAALFRGKFLAGLRQMLDTGDLHLPDPGLKTPATRAGWFSLLYNKAWVAYVKRPFGGPQQLLSYLANYTHRVALSNRRIVAVDARHQTATFTPWSFSRRALRTNPLPDASYPQWTWHRYNLSMKLSYFGWRYAHYRKGMRSTEVI